MSAIAIVAAGRLQRRRRGALVIACLAAIVVVAVVVALTLGATGLGPGDVIASLLGRGSRISDFIVLRLRLPRALAGVLAGVAFGLSGALFQSTLRNPLASPDILGVTGGASIGAVFVMLVLGQTGPAVGVAAFAGALVIAALMWALAWRGGLVGYRFVLIGVALAALVQAALGWMLTRADVRDARQALVWLVGGIGDVAWPEIVSALVALAVLCVLAGFVGRRMPLLQLDDDTARSLGVDAARARAASIVLAVALVAVGTALAGPVAFVALVSAPIARSLVGRGSAALGASALVGAAIVVIADLAAQYALLGGTRVPVGIVTGLIGAPYLLWLIATANRTGSDG
ncbi:iron chelate uptake ABC transporter family permease subunit [Rathayibacter sp. YIM 133350]|uniref:FecCD family ABC transporter permease n=1 Tax=Rathayibacter sp. YIM 133350 TaxID=3131992 RepID=UPI00307D13E6